MCACVYVCPTLPNGDDDDMFSIRLVSGPQQIYHINDADDGFFNYLRLLLRGLTPFPRFLSSHTLLRMLLGCLSVVAITEILCLASSLCVHSYITSLG